MELMSPFLYIGTIFSCDGNIPVSNILFIIKDKGLLISLCTNLKILTGTEMQPTIYCYIKLKIMRFYYNLSYNLLQSHFDNYLEVINKDLPCQYELRHTARPLIRAPKTRLVSIYISRNPEKNERKKAITSKRYI